MLFRKPKKVNIEFKTFDPYILKNHPPVAANKAYPEWWKKTTAFCDERVTSTGVGVFDALKAPSIKRCPALIENFSTGIVMPLWSDIDFYIDGKADHIEWRYSNNYEGINLVQPHPNDQFPHLAHKYLHAKIISPWVADCDSGITWLSTRPTYLTSEFDDQDVVYCDGMLNYKTNFSTNVNLFFPKRDKPYEVKFHAGTPFQKLIPLTERPINMTTSYCSKEYYKEASLFGRRISFYLGKHYNKLRKGD